MEIRISVFGSGKVSIASPEYRMAYELGMLLGKEGFVHVSGGYGGTMEAGAKGAREAGGKTIGITVSGWGPPNAYISENIPMPDLFARIGKLMELGDGYVVLPGATGTLIELSMAWERAQKGLDRVKPIVLLGDFWLPVIHLVKSQLQDSTPSEPGDEKCLFGGYLWLAKSPGQAVGLLKEIIVSRKSYDKSH